MPGLRDNINQAVESVKAAFKANEVVGALLKELIDEMTSQETDESIKAHLKAIEEIDEALQNANCAYLDSHAAVEQCLDDIDAIRQNEDYMSSKANQKDLKALDDLMSQTFQVVMDKQGHRSTCNDSIQVVLYEYESQFSGIKKHYGVEDSNPQASSSTPPKKSGKRRHCTIL